MVTETEKPVQPDVGVQAAQGRPPPALPADFLSTAFNHSIPPPGYIVPEIPAHMGPSPPGVGPQQKDEHLTVVIGRAKEHKSLMDSYILWFPLGLLGFHHFYLRRYEMGLVYFFTLGLGGVGWLSDLFRMPTLVKDANRRIDNPHEFHPKTIHDSYVLWFPFGLLGFHHYYLGHPAWGLLYTFTAGLAGIGWIVDGFRIPGMVKAANERLEREMAEPRPRQIHLCDAYALGATPLGIFGAHHFYMGRHSFGLFYLFTAGVCGIGWIVDWFRMKVLVDRANNPTAKPLGTRHKYLDDAYVLAFPLGLLGTHHFYLERPGWGVLYFFTLGLGGVGWLVDLVRMPCLVRDTNSKLEEELNVISGIREVIGAARCSISTRALSVEQSAAAEGRAGTDGVSSFSTLREPDIMGPPPYTAAMAGYSGYGHVYTVPAPAYLIPNAPAYSSPHHASYGAMGVTGNVGVPYPGPVGNVPGGQENPGYNKE